MLKGHAIRPSTLSKESYAVRRSTLMRIPYNEHTIELPPGTKDEFSINLHQKRSLDRILEKSFSYHKCNECQKNILNGACCCESKTGFSAAEAFSKEQPPLTNKMKNTEQSLATFKKARFREFRNSYGAGCATASAANIILANWLALGIAANITLVLIPVVIAVAFVYWRNKKEEDAIIRDHESALFSKKVDLYEKHAASVVARKYQPIPSPTPVPISCPEALRESKPLDLSQAKVREIQPYKEKRGIYVNSASHFFGAAVGTAAMWISVTKFGLLATAISTAAVVWPIAVTAVCIGLGFLVLRYRNLTRKRKFEIEMGKLNAEEEKLNKQIKPPVTYCKEAVNLPDNQRDSLRTPLLVNA